MLPRLQQNSLIVFRGERLLYGLFMFVQIVKSCWDEDVEEGDGGHSKLLHFRGGQYEQAVHKIRPHFPDPMQI